MEENIIEKAKSFILDILKTINIPADINIVQETDSIILNINGDNLGILIGRYGKTIDALQLLTNIAVNKNNENKVKITIDIEGYREKRKKSLENYVENVVKKIKETKREISLPPMNSYERRIVHNMLTDNPFVGTRSEGEDPERRIVIYPKKG